MQLYFGSASQFIEDTFRNRIAVKLTESFQRNLGYRPANSEIRSWEHSLRAMCTVAQYAEFKDQGILLEYQLPLSSKRLDCMITGRLPSKQASAVIVELKQWDKCHESNVPDCVTTFIGGRLRDQLHPSRQVGQYRDYIVDNQLAFADDQIQVDACAYLHNQQFKENDELYSQRHKVILDRFPVFTGDQSPQLTEYLTERLSFGEGMDVLGAVMASRYRPSKKLLEHTAAMVSGQAAFVLLDEQLVVFNAVIEQAKSGYHSSNKSVLLIHGGPGTGKSVLALHLVGELSRQGFNAQHATGSRAFTQNIRSIVGSRAASQFKYFNSYADAGQSDIDVLIMDEAHRIRETSVNQYTPKSKRSGLPQIDELIKASKVSVFFIDDRQVVRPNEIGSSVLIREAAAREGADLSEFDLDIQFRCGGSETFINWVETTLDIRRTQNVLLDETGEFDFRIVNSIHELDKDIRLRQSEGYSARLAAGFCWPWSDPRPDGTLVSDVVVGEWSMPWNAKSRNGKLAPGIPKEEYWASDPRGIEQVGCVYTAQGFEFDYAGVIWGPDLRYDPRLNRWIGDPKASADGMVKKAGQSFTELVKNVYRILLTRGLKGCYVYFIDEDTRSFVSSRIDPRSS